MKHNHLLIINATMVAIALATAWAVRGQFGHEHGAAWAGAVGVLIMLILAGRKDWFARMPAIVAIGAIGWGVGGMMSYGKIVGYGRGTDFINVSYGLLMLFLIGALYGFIGGGFTGLALESSRDHKPQWATLVTQMIAGGYLIWGILIYQLEWLMTPPRSELWAACLGAALALAWYMYRNGYWRSQKVALFSALGAGFGFAFGNFLQIIGNLSNISFNWWNVMEYSLGFFGGLGMAYGVFSEPWEKSITHHRIFNKLGWLFLVVMLPLTNIIQTFEVEKLQNLGQALEMVNVETFVMIHLGLAWGVSALLALTLTWYFWRKLEQKGRTSYDDMLLFLLVYLGWYILLSNLIGGSWFGGSNAQFLYWINWIAIWIFICFRKKLIRIGHDRGASVRLLMRLSMISVLLLFFLSFVLVMSHEELPGTQIRFE